jgi:L,D-transpeptidase catalytic domain/Putative peptidoglycan binding domain
MTAAGAWLLGLGGALAISPSAAASTVQRAVMVQPVSTMQRASTGQQASTVQSARPTRYRPAKRVLYPGMHGRAVRRLQRRLATLKYYPGRIDGRFGLATLEAVWAFKEVQGIQTSRHPNVVGHVMQRDLVHPRLPKILVHHRGQDRRRIEVNQNIEVLVLYHHRKVELISHVSTGAGCLPGQGCGWITPDGNYRALWFARGWVTVPLGYMYNPVFFIGGSYAIHGDIPVPLYPASHGCVRIPMDISQFFHKLIHVSFKNGTPIFIRGRAPGT